MGRIIRHLTWIALAGNLLWGQGAGEEPAIGYLRIFTDTDRIQIYLDGAPIGYSPILEKIPLQPGWHTISFFAPDFKWTHWTHRQRRMITNVIEAGTRQVLIKPGELETLDLYWRDLEQQLERYESGRLISALVGIGMVTIAMLLIAAVL